jgi:hypothetical protein
VKNKTKKKKKKKKKKWWRWKRRRLLASSRMSVCPPVCLSVCLSVSPHGTIRRRLDGFSWNFSITVYSGDKQS